MMNLFEINYLERMSALLREAFQFKKYKAMRAGAAIFSGILMIPFVISSFFWAAILFCLAFVYESTCSLVKSLHALLQNEGREVKHATQFIVYFLSWPTVFSLYAFECFLLALMIPVYAIFSFLVYFWTFGGVKFHLFAKDAQDISVEVTGKYKSLPFWFALGGHSCLFIFPLIHGILKFVQLYFDYHEESFPYIFFGTVYPRYIAAYLLFVFLFTLIAMVSHPREQK